MDRTTMNGKPVLTLPSRTIINFKSGFSKKLLCDGMTFSTGTACAYSCSFCYVPSTMRKLTKMTEGQHMAHVIRRKHAIEALRSQLTDRKGLAKFIGQAHNGKVVYASPLVDVAANMDLVRETIEVCKHILMLTGWQIRLLSKSNLLPKVAQGLADWQNAKQRVIYGVSTGTLDDSLAAAFEEGTPKVSKRIESLHWLQDNGYRTFGMICPSLPPYREGYRQFALDAYKAIRGQLCEHVWAEVLNTRGESTQRTAASLRRGGYDGLAGEVERIMGNRDAWEEYARETFLAHAWVCHSGQLRFLQYVTKETRPWWQTQTEKGAVLL